MIVVFGSLNADLIFTVKALPRAGETVITESYIMEPGGKGANQAVAAARSGADTKMVGCVGNDPLQAIVLEALHRSAVDDSAIKRVEAMTGCATITVDDRGENQIAVGSGANLSIRAVQVPDTWLRPGTIVCMQMETPHDENWALARRAQDRGARVILNVAPAAPVPDAALHDIDLLVVNELESVVVAAGVGEQTSDPVAAGRYIARRFNKTCIVTRGAQGAIAFTSDGEYHAGALAISPLDSTGAGDTFLGAFAAATHEGRDLPQALRYACVAGSIACERRGAQVSIPTAAEIAQRLDEAPPPEWSADGLV